MEIKGYQKLISLSKDQDGIFSIKDLEVILDKKSDASLYREVKYLQEVGELIKVKRGIYATKTASLFSISNRIIPNSYISTGTVLAKNIIIGSIPAKRVQAVTIGAPKIFSCSLGTIEYFSISKKLYFGFEKSDCINWATSEKAFLDACYYFYKGKKFSFDLESDVNLDRLDFEIINKYLTKYDKRFVTFFKKIWS